MPTLAALLIPLGLSAAAEGNPDPGAGLSVEQRMDLLDQEVRILKRHNEAQDAAAKAKDAVTVGAGAGGFTIATADKANSLKIGLLVQTDGRFWLVDNSTPRQGTDTFTFAKIRPQFSGTIAGWVDYRFLPEFAGTVGIQDAFIDLNLNSGFKVLIGKAKVPLGLERAQSDTALLFPERGITDRLVPNRDVGVQLHGDVGLVGYGLGIYDGAADGSSRDTDTNDDKSAAGRVWATPFKSSPSPWINGLLVGAGGSIGYEEGAASLPGGAAATGYRTPLSGSTFFSYGTTTISEGVVYRASPQLFWSLAHGTLLADYVAVSQGIERPGVSSRAETHAWQIAASWVLTGERPTFAGVKPKQPFAPGSGTWGAWELAARYGRLDIDDQVFATGFRTRAQTASGVSTFAVGVNWYPTSFLKWQTAFEESVFDDGAGSAAAPADRDPEHFLITRVSFFF